MTYALTLAEWSIVDALARNWAIVVMLTTVVVLVIVPAAVIAKYARISLNIMRSTRPPLSHNPLDFDRMSGEPVSFPAYDGLRLNGMIVRAEPNVPRRGLIIFAHEYCSDMHSCARYCRPLQEVGYDILTFDFRGHGQSDGDAGYTPRQWVTCRELHDMRGAVAFARSWLSERGLPRRVGAFGISRGACAAILVAAENSDIEALASDGVFSTDTTIEYFMKRWANIFGHERVNYDIHPPAFWRLLRWTMMLMARHTFKCRFPSVRKAIVRMTPRPMLFIHGEKDSYLPVEQSRRLYALAGQPKHLWVVPGARHNRAAIMHPAHYARRTVEFFNRYLGLPCDAERAERQSCVAAAGDGLSSRAQAAKRARRHATAPASSS